MKHNRTSSINKKTSKHEVFPIQTQQERIIYYRPDPMGYISNDSEPNVIEVTFPLGPTIDEFKNICAALALNLGYHEDIVVETFGIKLSDSIKDLNIIKSYRK